MKRYSSALKAEVINEVQSGKSCYQVCKERKGLNLSTVIYWVKKAREAGDPKLQPKAISQSSLLEENKRLKAVLSLLLKLDQ